MLRRSSGIMGETQGIVAMWRRALTRGERVALATVVHVEGSSYRKPGARMLVTEGGERSGTVSGGCLEAEVARKIWWLTENGPTLQRYQSSFDEDGGMPWGLGCGGTVWLLLERDPLPVLEALAAAVENGAAAIAVSRLISPVETLGVIGEPHDVRLPLSIRPAAARCLRERRSFALDADGAETAAVPDYFMELLQPPPRLTIFGAGDDALPIARFAEALGWRIAVADGRSNLLRRERFPEAQELRQLAYDGESGDVAATGVAPGELAVVLTHSFDQDSALLRALLPAGLLYLGILGPRHRTERLLDEAAPALGWSREECWAQLHAPVGLDLGARDPAGIALAIVAELQAVLAGRKVEVLRQQWRPNADMAASRA